MNFLGDFYGPRYLIKMLDGETPMHILQASLVINAASGGIFRAFVFAFCALGVAFMLRFLVALSKERKIALGGYRLEYRINDSLPRAAHPETPHVFSNQPLSKVADANQRESDRGEFSTVTSRALKHAKLTFEYRLVDRSRQEPDRA